MYGDSKLVKLMVAQRPREPLVSVIIPVYRESRVLGRLLEKLCRDPYPRKEIIVVADEPLDETLGVLRSFPEVKVIVNEKRVGKVQALNEGVAESRGDLLVFLDNDVEPASTPFIGKVVEAMRDADIGEIKKEIQRTSLVARMTYYDYVGMNFGNYLFSRFVRRCVGFNGAAFVLWRDALEKLGGFRRFIAEDLDLGIRSYKLGLRFTYINSVKVLNYVPGSWKWWFKQRKRWAVGAGAWIREYWRDLLRLLRNNAKIALVTLLLLFPPLATLVFALLAYNEFLDKLLLLAFLLATSQLTLLLPLATIATYRITYTIFKNLVMSLVAAFFFGLYYYYACRKLDFTFKPHEFLAYFFVYSPMYMVLMASGIIRVIVFSNTSVEDWKI